jgi:hypothetical protein
MPIKEKARENREPILNAVPWQDSTESKATPLNLQVSRLTRRCGVDAGMAETLAPIVFGALS